jgi:AcrR family transcriptional regulator
MVEKIIQVATKMFNQQGYYDTSVAELISKVGISKGGFFHHFTSKEILLEKVLENYYQEKIFKVIQHLNKDQELLEFIKDYLYYTKNSLLQSNFSDTCLLIKIGWEINNPKILHTITSKMILWEELLTTVLIQKTSGRELPLKSTELSMLLIGFIQNLGFSGGLHKDKNRLEWETGLLIKTIQALLNQNIIGKSQPDKNNIIEQLVEESTIFIPDE